MSGSQGIRDKLQRVRRTDDYNAKDAYNIAVARQKKAGPDNGGLNCVAALLDEL